MSVASIYRSNPGLWLTLVKLGISIGVSLALTKWLVKMMEPMIDPHYKQKKEAEKSRETHIHGYWRPRRREKTLA
jgi:hypothetical protein